MKVFFPILKGSEIKDKDNAFLNSHIWNTFYSPLKIYLDDYDIIEYEANYAMVLIKMYQRHSGDPLTKWKLAFKDMDFYFNWMFKK